MGASSGEGCERARPWLRMKRVVPRIGWMAVALLLGGSCLDVVTSRYETRAAAEADRLFERGWLPAILPSSSRNIRTRNDLDSNHSEGEFAFAPEEAAAFIRQLRRMHPAEVSGTDGVRFLERGYWPHAYQDEDAEWIFFLNAEQGHCEYRMTPRREGSTDQAAVH